MIEGRRVQTGSRVTLEPRAIKDLLGRQELLEAMDSQVNRERLVTWVRRAQVGPVDRMDNLGLLGPQVELEPVVLRDRKVDPVQWVRRDRLVPRAPLETSVELVTPDHRVNRVIKASKDRRDLKALKVPQDRRVIKEAPAQPETRDSKAIKDLKDLRVIVGLLETQGNLD